MRETELDFFETTPLFLPDQMSCQVTEAESSLVEVAIVEMILGLETLLLYSESA